MEKLNQKTLRVAFLHMAPRNGEIDYNIHLLETMLRQAVVFHPDLVLTPELAVSGYEFHQTLGSRWIETGSPEIIERFCCLAAEYRIALALGAPYYDAGSGNYSNAAVLIDENGQVAGVHHKILVLPGSLEGWASPGSAARPVMWRGYKLGLMICADASSERLAAELAQRGSQVLINLAAWAPGEHAPDGEWEQRSRETGLPLLVCNRTGQSATLNFEGSSSVVVADGRRITEYAGIPPAILTMDFNQRWQPLSAQFSSSPIESEP